VELIFDCEDRYMPILENFIYGSKAQIVFAYIPKAACSNWKCILRYLQGYSNYLDTNIFHDRKKSGLIYLSELENAEEILYNASIPKLTFVRNPYTRILSAYLNKIKPFSENESILDMNFYQIYINIDNFRKKHFPKKKIVDFECFINWLYESKNCYTQNEHWIPQSTILGLDKVKFDFIGKFERFSTDVAKILKIMKCDIPFPTQKDINFPPTRANELVDYYYNSELVEKVKKIYLNDFLLLNYSFDLKDCRKGL